MAAWDWGKKLQLYCGMFVISGLVIFFFVTSSVFGDSMRAFLMTILLLVQASVMAASLAGAPGDPPAAQRPRASMETVALQVNGARINTLLYLSGGPGPHPVVLLLHGFPGNEKNLDLAQALRRAGNHVMFIDYRGNWGSGGSFSFANALEDTQAALAWLRDPQNAGKYRLDASRIALIGHSMGGWLALMAGAQESPRVCVAGIAAWNIGADGEQVDADPRAAKEFLDGTLPDTSDTGGPINASAAALMAEIHAHVKQWNYLSQAAALSKHSVLLASATGDGPSTGVAVHTQLAAAIRAAGGKDVQALVYDDDHSLSSHRLALTDAVTRWLRTSCARSQAAGKQ
jgi:pimeloyl-ACP methyl ester carboxylesterase